MLKLGLGCLAGFSILLGIMTAWLSEVRPQDSAVHFLLWDHEGDIYRMMPDGRGSTQLTYFEPELVYIIKQTTPVTIQNIHTDEVFQLNVDGTLKKLPKYPEDARLLYSPDGKWIAFEAFSTNDPEINLMPASNPQAQVNITQHEGYDGSPAWSPDGEWLAFISDRDGSWDIYKIRRDLSDLQRLTFTSFEHEGMPLWSPDGKWIYYTNNNSSLEVELYRMHADGTHVERLTYWNGSDTSPVWSEAIDSTWHPHWLAFLGGVLGVMILIASVVFKRRKVVA